MEKTLLATLATCALCLLVIIPRPGRADGGWIDEAKLGLLAHDVPLFDPHIENGVDVNGELLFKPLTAFPGIGTLRPHLGMTVNTEGETSYAYTGLTGTAKLIDGVFRPGDGIFGSLGLGGAIHDNSNTGSPGHVGLGSRLLFHEELDLGYRFAGAADVSLFMDHLSNADIGRHNPGMTNLGIRTGYNF
ncbi:MAG TPA: acyloxyacyl hydrolase [Stellaceae bacterium]|nr:acyloxyacyl hydrolase [Stellaceae bacterium]